MDAVHIVVVGCGRVGSSLGIALVRAGHSVVIIDKSEPAFRRLPADWGGRAIHGMGFDRHTLDEAGAERAGALAAVTNGDNSNILCARIARETYEIPAVVARIYDPRRAEIYQRLGIPTVATVTWTIEQVQRRLFPTETITEWTDPSGQVQLIERAIPFSWCGRRLQQIEGETGAQVVAVTRAGIARVGAGELVGQEGDVLHLAVNALSRERVGEAFHEAHEEARVARS
ncbi:MAG TPA: TrkA family potassium uptake protein [Acidimicrobiales bacterium]|nr:TrkA family potassium uptake protein [Acidimicrobiales bacterium]